MPVDLIQPNRLVETSHCRQPDDGPGGGSVRVVSLQVSIPDGGGDQSFTVAFLLYVAQSYCTLTQ